MSIDILPSIKAKTTRRGQAEPAEPAADTAADTAADRTAPAATVRRPATLAEARALAHPLRLRILRLCLDDALTNRQLADRLGMDPGTVHFHVRKLARNGFLAAEEVRHGASGALERPYRATRKSWKVDTAGTEVPMAMIDAVRDELAEAGPKALVMSSRLGLRLTPSEVDELQERVAAIVDEFSHRDDPTGVPIGLYVALHYRAADVNPTMSPGEPVAPDR